MMISRGVLLCVAFALAVTAVVTAEPSSFFSKVVEELDEDSFPTFVARPNQLAFVTFYRMSGCDACKTMRSDYINACTDLKGIASCASVDPKLYGGEEAYKELAVKYKVASFPTVLLFKGGDQEPIEYTDKLVKKQMITFAKSHVLNTVQRLDGMASHKKFLKQAPKMAKTILFTSKKTTTTLWKAMSHYFSGRLIVGEALKTDRKIVKQYGIKEFPSIVVIPAKTAGDDDEPEPRQYVGPIKAPAIKSWLKLFAVDPPGGPEELPIPELVDDSCMKAHCADLGGICAILVTPTTDDRRLVQNYVDIFNEVREAQTDTFVKFSWMEGSKQTEFINKVFNGMQPVDYPQLVILHPRKMRYAVYVGSYTIDDVKTWIAKVIKAVEPTFPVAGMSALPSLALEGEGVTGNACEKDLKKLKKKAALGSGSASDAGGQAGGQERGEPDPNADPTDWKRFYRQPNTKRGILYDVKHADWENLTQMPNPVLVRFQDKAVRSKKAEELSDAEKQEVEFQSNYELAGRGMNNMVKFASMPCDVNDDFFKRWLAPKLTGANLPLACPVTVVLPSKYELFNKKLTREDGYRLYTGGQTTADFTKEAMSHLDNAPVGDMNANERIHEQNLSMDPQIPQFIFFTAKPEPSVMVRSLAIEFFGYGQVIVSANDPKAQSTFQVQKVPSIRIMYLSKKPEAKPGTLEVAVLEPPAGTAYWDICMAFDQMVQKRAVWAKPVDAEPAAAGSAQGSIKTEL